MTDTQVKTKQVSIRKVMMSAAFVKGWKDGRSSAPWPDENLLKNVTNAWNYERGRQYGVLYPHISPKKGNQVSSAAARAFVDSVVSGYII